MCFILVLFPLSPDPGKDFKHFCGYGLVQEFRHRFAQISQNKVFRRGHTSEGRFLGFELLPINHHGQIMAVKITGDNTE